MDTSTHTNQPQPRRLAVKAAIVVLGLGLAAMLLFYPFLVGRAEAILERFDQPSKSGGAEALSGPDQTTATFTPTNTQVINSTWTSTATATATETATNPPPTSTETATPPPELTPTNTATKTGTQPTPTMTATPTVTGTLVPNPTLIVKVKPTEAYIGQKFTFDIVIGNSGTGPLTEVIISDHFPSYINVETVASQRGVVTRSPHSFGVSVGYVNPGETINITAVVKVTSNALVTETIPNVVTMTYYPSKSKTASVNYKVIASALPGTGGLPSVRQQAPPVNASALRQSLLAGLLGLILIVYALWSQRQGARTPRWMPLSGVLLLLLALGSGLAAAGIFGPAPPEQAAALPEASTAPLEGVQAAAGHPRAVDFVTPEAQPLMTLPVYEIPTPVVSATAEPGEQEPDTTAIKRIIIPYLLVDTVVAYIPFDGNTWLIGGLTQEVAWMGDTSWPGLGGNTGLAGHVTVTGQGDGPFRYLDELPAGELVILYTEKNMYTYQVRQQTIVSYEDLSVTYATANPQITLITCTNWSDEDEAWLDRLIVYADLVRTDPIRSTGSN